MHNLLTEALLRARRRDGAVAAYSLPGIFALLAQDALSEFPALRRHQRHAWHSLTVQLAAIALHAAGGTEPPTDEDRWRQLLRGLTTAFPGDEPWCLVSPPKYPAFLQAPAPPEDLAAFKPLSEPDAIDVLVTAKNHDVKGSRIAVPAPDDWLFALVTLQTMEGVMGAGNYGISRMNGGYGSRPCVVVLAGTSPGVRFTRDLQVLLRKRAAILERAPFLRPDGGLTLVWLRRWNGRDQIAPEELDPYYIEICRRLRLAVGDDGRLYALTRGSEAARIAAKGLNGVTGDPWAPVDVANAKVLSVASTGFDYRLMQRLLFDAAFQPSIMQEIQPDDPEEGLAIIVCALARGQGKTEGYHERVVPIARKVRSLLNRRHADPLAKMSGERVMAIGTVRGKVLRPALFSLGQGGPDEVDYGSVSSDTAAKPWLARLDQWADATFFPDLWTEAEAAEPDRPALRHAWLKRLSDAALALLDEAAGATPMATIRHYRALVRSRGLFHALLYRNFDMLRPEDRVNDAAA